MSHHFLAAGAPAPHVTISVDATEAPRKIFHAQLTIPAKPGNLTLYYPKWIPGEHGPTGPIQDLAGLKFTANGKTLTWRRDLLDGWTFHVEVPAGASSVDAALDFISPAGQKASYTGGATATDRMAVLNWNDVLLYPEGWTSDELTYTASLRSAGGVEIRHLAGGRLAGGRRNQVRSGFADHAGRSARSSPDNI